MDGSVTVSYRLERKPLRPPTLVKAAPAAEAPPPLPKVRPDRTARMLALAHHIERLIDGGVLEDYADAATRFGLSRARITQIANLLSLSPKIQEAILAGNANVAERGLRLVLRKFRWQEQEQLVFR
jgi:hypothetical protein